MRINNNLMAMNTHRQYAVNNNSVSKATERLSSGLKINRAGDDAAGLAISEKMRAQIRGLNMASKNSEDAISLVQTAEGALTETHAILQRMNELAVQAASDTNDDETANGVDRAALQAEFAALIEEIDDIAELTTFNKKNLLDGNFAGDIQTGANENETLEITIGDMSAEGLAVDTLNIGTKAGASAAITAVQTAVNTVSTQRASLGAIQNRLEHKINNLNTSAENLQAAESRIRDIDMAKEMTNFTTQNILVQAATAMLAQANAAPQNVLSLLK